MKLSKIYIEKEMPLSIAMCNLCPLSIHIGNKLSFK